MDAEEKKRQDYYDANDAYEKAFHRVAPWLLEEMSREDVTALLRRCIKEGKPYRRPFPNLSDEKREYIYVREDYEAMFGSGTGLSIRPESYTELRELTAIMRQCMKEGKRYVPPPIPEGVVL